ncbi:pyrroline-5-carboxylate reductase [Salaquimonas pukyongi]|uniref:pyrroline-5-carboxylate reductase n=1 Tax=Salaquimonas pukyongi TaxID=2712698 RepID=UPI00096BAE42|nr:pyrroline-5-carboxylate reductase [Salaquimonas pukyongi]
MADAFELCLIGAGNMGGAMLAGWMEGGFPAERVTVIDPSPSKAMVELLSSHGIRCCSEPPSGYQPDVMVIAVKPQVMDTVLPSIASAAGQETVCVSVAAGTTLARLATHLGEVPVIRSMPNTPAILRKGITVCCANARCNEMQKERVGSLLSAIGKVRWVEDERLIDAVTAVSGSGPAYVFHLAECMAAAGVNEGLPPDLADALARETVAGAGAMLSQLDEPSGALRENVTSPNGTTAAALGVLMGDQQLEMLVKRAVHAARLRSEELSA